VTNRSEKDIYKIPTTKAVAIEQYGDRNVLQWKEVELPFELRDDQLLIRVKAASINRLDVDMRFGYGQLLFESQRKFPLVLGSKTTDLFLPSTASFSSLM
jgi:NADPH:quinone reductase-like Zn-dependent oxidoreductase